VSVWDGTGYTSGSRLLLIPVAKCLWKQNWFQVIYPNLSWMQYLVLLPCACLRNILRKWFMTTVLTLPTHVLQPHRILFGFSVRIQKQFFHVFQLFALEVEYFYLKNTWKNSQIILICEKWFKTWNNFGKEFASEGVEAVYIVRTIFFIYSYFKSCVCWYWSVTFMQEKFFKKENSVNISQKFHRLGNIDLLSWKGTSWKNRFRWFRWWIWQWTW